MKNKRGFELSELAKILIAVVVLVLLVFAVMFLIGDKGKAILDSIKNLLRFGRA